MQSSGHSFLEHTSDVELRLHGRNLAALFTEAGRAVADLMLGDAPRPAATVSEQVLVEATDREALLAAWIDELVFRAETRKAVFVDFELEHLDDHELRARIRGIAEPVIKTAIKAATFHGLEVIERDGRFEATVILDV